MYIENQYKVMKSWLDQRELCLMEKFCDAFESCSCSWWFRQLPELFCSFLFCPHSTAYSSLTHVHFCHQHPFEWCCQESSCHTKLYSDGRRAGDASHGVSESYLRCLVLNCAEDLLALGWEHQAGSCDCSCFLGSRILWWAALNVRRLKMLKCLQSWGDSVAPRGTWLWWW